MFFLAWTFNPKKCSLQLMSSYLQKTFVKSHSILWRHEGLPPFYKDILYMSYVRNYLFGEMPSPNVGGPLSVIRVLDVRDINIKAGACNLHSGMIWFATYYVFFCFCRLGCSFNMFASAFHLSDTIWSQLTIHGRLCSSMTAIHPPFLFSLGQDRHFQQTRHCW